MNVTPSKKVTAIFSMGDINHRDRAMALRDKGYSQKRLAEHCGVSEPAISQFLKGERNSLYLALTLSSVTGLTVSQLFPCGKYDKLLTQQSRLLRAAKRISQTIGA